ADVTQGKHMVGRLQDPAPSRRLRIQVLQEALVESVRLHVAMTLQPTLVARHAIDAVIAQALEYLRGDVGAFLRLTRRHFVQGVELRREQTHQVELRLHPDAVETFAQASGPGGMRMDQAPGKGRRHRGIAHQQPVQEGRAAARHARDEDRPLDGAREHCGVIALAALEFEQVVEASPDLELDGIASETVEIALRIAGGDEALQRLNERAVMESVPSDALERCREHVRDVERPRALPRDDPLAQNPLLSIHHTPLTPYDFRRDGSLCGDVPASAVGQSATRRRGCKNAARPTRTTSSGSSRHSRIYRKPHWCAPVWYRSAIASLSSTRARCAGPAPARRAPP